MLIRRTTRSTVETVLACDPAVVRANGGAEVDRLGDIHRDALIAAERLRSRPDDDPDRIAAERASQAAEEAYLEAQRVRDERLAAYRESRDMSSIEVPGDATRYTLRPLSTEERMTVGEAGLELALAARDAEGDAARAHAIRAHRLEAQARVRLGVVRAVDRLADGGELAVTGAELLDALPDGLLYPVILELDHAIRRLSSVDPVGKGR